MARQQNRAHLDLGDEKIPEKKVEAIGGLRRGGRVSRRGFNLVNLRLSLTGEFHRTLGPRMPRLSWMTKCVCRKDKQASRAHIYT